VTDEPIWQQGPNFVVHAHPTDPALLRVTRRSPRTGQHNTLDLPVTLEQIEAWRSRRKLVQEAMPHLTPDQREFLMTGYTAEDWAILFPPEKDEE
jgi:hypothetical protein